MPVPHASSGGRGVIVPAHAEAFDALPTPVWIGDSRGREAWVSSAWVSTFGSEGGRARPFADWIDMVVDEHQLDAFAAWGASLRDRSELRLELRMGTERGERWFRVVGRFDELADGVTRWSLVFTDVHEYLDGRSHAAAQVEVRDAMLDGSVDCVKLLTPDGLITHMNRAGCLALGVPVDSDFGMPWLELLPSDTRRRGRRALARTQQGRTARFRGRSETKAGEVQYWDNILTPAIDEDGTVTAILCVSRNVTEQRRVESRLRATSELDDLTGLPNRRYFNRALQREISRLRSSRQGMLALMLGDLDHFKAVNDTLGHSAGDHLLEAVAERLQDAVGGGGLVARLGGDEFAVLAPVDTEEDAVRLGRALLEEVGTQVTVEGRTISSGLSLGCALFPRDAQDASALLRCADTALHDLKDAGRGGLRMFTSDMLASARRRAEELERAARVVQEDRVEVHLQRRVRLVDGEVVGFEALLRWRDDDGEVHPPATVAEAFGDFTLATQLTEQMHRKLFAALGERIRAGVRLLPVSVNASSVEFLRADYAERLLAQLAEHGVPPRLVQVEVAEHALTARGTQFVQEALRELKAARVGVALDDFGSGSASFVHLRRYSVDCLKIDAELVRRMPRDSGAMAIVRAIVALGQSFGLDVVAEGVETNEQRVALVAAGCGYAEGHLFGEAGPVDEVLVGARRS